MATERYKEDPYSYNSVFICTQLTPIKPRVSLRHSLGLGMVFPIYKQRKQPSLLKPCIYDFRSCGYYKDILLILVWYCVVQHISFPKLPYSFCSYYLKKMKSLSNYLLFYNGRSSVPPYVLTLSYPKSILQCAIHQGKQKKNL